MSYLYLAVAIWSGFIFTIHQNNWLSRLFVAIPALVLFISFGGLALKSFGLF